MRRGGSWNPGPDTCHCLLLSWCSCLVPRGRNLRPGTEALTVAVPTQLLAHEPHPHPHSTPRWDLRSPAGGAHPRSPAQGHSFKMGRAGGSAEGGFWAGLAGGAGRSSCPHMRDKARQTLPWPRPRVPMAATGVTAQGAGQHTVPVPRGAGPMLGLPQHPGVPLGSIWEGVGGSLRRGVSRTQPSALGQAQP